MIGDVDCNRSTNLLGVFFIGIGKETELQGLAAACEPCIGVIVGRSDGNIGNVLVAECDSCEPRVQRLDQRPVGAIVRRHLSLCHRTIVCGLEVRIDVCTTEAVDGLLGIAHHDECQEFVGNASEVEHL
ncbi:unannotated protein [freshwater metagenome]|uniref:Unannotated protein n=1 Tax=freshwater metagenome TaxID=449393 RepID=A0A6J7JMA9_9ZZZZ